MGSDTTVSALKWQFAVPIKANVKLLKDARASGKDCKGVKFADASSKGQRGGSIFCIFNFLYARIFFYTIGNLIDVGLEMCRIMGSDTTPNGIRFQFTDRFRPLSKRQLAMLANGQDPKDVVVDTKC